MRHATPLIFASFLACFAQAQPASQPATRPFAISRETTHVTSPVRADGTIDYVAAANARLAQGVTRENNAAIPLIDILHRTGDGRVAHFNRVRAELGLPPLPAEDDKAPDVGWPEPENYDRATTGPWVSRDAPKVEAFLNDLKPRLDVLVAASRRDRYHMPLFRTQPDDSLVSILLPHLHEMRPLCRALKARALFKLGSDDIDGFCADAIALVRIGRLTASSSTLVEKLVAMSCESMGLEALQVGATGGWLSPAQATRMMDDLDRLAAAPLYDAFDLAERAFLLEFLQATAVHGHAYANQALRDLGGLGNNAPLLMGDPSLKDWNAALRKANQWYDRVAAAGQQPTFAARQKAADQINQEILQLKNFYAGWRAVFAPIEDRLFILVLPAMGRAYETEARVEARRILAATALALSIYRSRTGEFPDQLAELTPAILKSVPSNPFTGQPLIYKREGTGYSLSSPGPSKDDSLSIGAQR